MAPSLRPSRAAACYDLQGVFQQCREVRGEERRTKGRRDLYGGRLNNMLDPEDVDPNNSGSKMLAFLHTNRTFPLFFVLRHAPLYTAETRLVDCNTAKPFSMTQVKAVAEPSGALVLAPWARAGEPSWALVLTPWVRADEPSGALVLAPWARAVAKPCEACQKVRFSGPESLRPPIGAPLSLKSSWLIGSPSAFAASNSAHRAI